ncbi:DUF4304 domain-containing protein [Rhodococcus hoagii]|nr:DUF4304 domain-containing protein [Prescottella equi]
MVTEVPRATRGLERWRHDLRIRRAGVLVRGRHRYCPLLKSHGFRKQKLTFTRDRGGLTDVVNLQRSAGNSHESIRFYVNCGVYSAEFARVVGRVPQERPKEVDCQFRRRIEPRTRDRTTRHGDRDTDVSAVAEQARPRSSPRWTCWVSSTARTPSPEPRTPTSTSTCSGTGWRRAT